MRETEELVEVIHAALDPGRFLDQLRKSGQGRAFLSGESDEVRLTREFLDREAAVAQEGLRALEDLRRASAE